MEKLVKQQQIRFVVLNIQANSLIPLQNQEVQKLCFDYNNLFVKYINLWIQYSIDYLAMPGIKEDTKQRGATLITINKSGEYEIKPYRLIELE